MLTNDFKTMNIRLRPIHSKRSVNWRMKQFYETYHDNEKLSSLVRELPWTHNNVITPIAEPFSWRQENGRDKTINLC
jgi:hypothetical protein